MNRISRAACVTIVGVLGFTSINAQEVESTGSDQAVDLGAVQVTGTRIGRNEGNYVGPMTVIDGDALRSISTGSLRDALQELPAIGFQATGRNNSNGGRGAEYTEIHQLQTERTLVLVNGRRTVSTIRDSTGLGVDLQAIPINMVERIEVLADGASAIYGSDAIGGVVNVITKREYQGISIDLSSGTPEDDGGDNQGLGLLMGVSGESGFLTAGITVNRNTDVDLQDRSWSKKPILGVNDDGQGTVLTLFGSGIPPEGRQPDAGIIFKPDSATGASYQNYDTFALGPLSANCANPGSVECIEQIGHRFNYNDIEQGSSLINGGTVISASVIGEVRLKNEMTAYVDMLTSHRQGRLHFTPLPIADAAGRFTDLIQVTYDNPHIPADALPVIQDATCEFDAGGNLVSCPRTFQMWWRGLDAGVRTFDYSSQTFKLTSGLTGDFSFGDRVWNWDTWMTVGRSAISETTDGQINVARLRTAVDVDLCDADPDCPKVTADNLAEQPGLAIGDPLVDIFGRNSFTQAEVDYLLFDDQEETTYETYHLASAISGAVIDLPAGVVNVASGIEWRKERGAVQTSGVVQAGDSGGNFAEPTSGEYELWEAYAEFSLPLLSGVALANELSIDGALRFSDYSTFGSETTYKGALSWAPTETLRFRGVMSTGYRAPNILELFGGTADSFDLVGDPCNAPIDDPVTQANCTADGVPAGFVSNSAQMKVSRGGNPLLEPETSDSFSFGLVWEPETIKNLRIALDYYAVEVENAISSPEASEVIGRCYSTGPAGALSAPECARIDRGASGEVVRFDLLLENLNSVETSGIDLNTRYRIFTDFGQWELDWLVNYLEEYREITGTGAVNDRTGVVAGAVAEFSAYPEWRSNMRLGLVRDNWSANLTWRYIDEMKVFDVFEFDNVNTSADAVNYLDLNLEFDREGWSVMVGVDNLTAEDPPYVPDVSVNTSTAYDWLGRVFYVRAGVEFQ